MDITCYNSTSSALYDIPSKKPLWDRKLFAFTSALTSLMISWLTYNIAEQNHQILQESSRRIRISNLILSLAGKPAIGAVVTIFKDMADLDRDVAITTLHLFRDLIKEQKINLSSDSQEALAYV